MFVCYVFFFKQKTAYEMRISDWSSDVCSSDLYVAEITRRHGKRHLLLQPGSAAQPAPEVVDNLGGDTCPIDGINRTQVVFGFELQVAGECLDDVLAFIEHALARNIVNISVLKRIHLGALKCAHAAVRRQHENR